MFSPEHYKIFADEILKKKLVKTPNSAIHRAAISRLYYYAFLLIREAIFSNYPDAHKMLTRNSVNVHSVVKQTMYLSNNTAISFSLDKLRDLRNDSDYRLLSVINEKTLELCNRCVETIEKEMSGVLFNEKFGICFQKAIEMHKKEKV